MRRWVHTMGPIFENAGRCSPYHAAAVDHQCDEENPRHGIRNQFIGEIIQWINCIHTW